MQPRIRPTLYTNPKLHPRKNLTILFQQIPKGPKNTMNINETTANEKPMFPRNSWIIFLIKSHRIEYPDANNLNQHNNGIFFQRLVDPKTLDTITIKPQRLQLQNRKHETFRNPKSRKPHKFNYLKKP